MKRRHDFIKNMWAIKYPWFQSLWSVDLWSFHIPYMEFYIIPYSNNLKAHVSDLMAKGKTPLTMEDIITRKKTKDFPSPPTGLSSGSCWEWPSVQGRRNAEQNCVIGKNTGFSYWNQF